MKMKCLFCNQLVEELESHSEISSFPNRGISIINCPICKDVLVLCSPCYAVYRKSDQAIRHVINMHDKDTHISVELVD